MKKNDINNLIENLQGFDGEELQREMTDGLEDWCQRQKQRGHEVKRVLLIALLLLTSTAIALAVLPRTLFNIGKEENQCTQSATGTSNPRNTQHQSTEPIPIDSVVVKKSAPEPVDYYYTGVAEDGYSVAYGHDTRTLTYTRYSGSHLIHSVVHNSPDIFFTDTADADTGSAVLPKDEMPLAAPATHSLVTCDFQSVTSQGDALYYIILDSASRQVSVRGDVARWMGQPIRYSSVVTIPPSVEFEGQHYTVTAVLDSAFMGHDEIEAVNIPATVTRIGDYAFADCFSLERIVVKAQEPPEAFPATFDHVDAHLKLYVPCGSGNTYANDAEWLYFRNLSEDCRTASPRVRVIRKP